MPYSPDYTAMLAEAQKQVDGQKAASESDCMTVVAVKDEQIAHLNADIAGLQKALADCQASHPTEPVDPPVEPPVTPPGAFQWPSASNTGVPVGTALTASGSITASTANAIIEGKDVNGTITVTAANVTIRKCKCKGIVSTVAGASGLKVEDCTIVGTGQLCGIEGKGTFIRCNISGFQNGGRPSGIFAIKACFIHTPKTTAAEPHYDGLEIYSKTTDGLVEDNTIDFKDTSCVFLSNLWGSHDNVRVNHNKLTGADVLARFEGNKSSASVTNVSFTNNMCGPSHWQQLDIVSCNPLVEGNTDLSGKPLSKAYLTTNQPD